MDDLTHDNQEAVEDDLPAGDESVAPEPEETVEVEAADEVEAAEEAAIERSPEDIQRDLCALECILFIAGEPLPVDRIAQAIEREVTDIPRLCDQLNEHLAGHGLHVVQLAGGFALATRPELADYVQRLLEPEPERLSIQALETLAIIAYRQPITRPEVDLLRGVNSGGVVTSLLEKGLVRIKGRKDAPGRPFLLETTAHFLSSFGLKDLTDLPKVDLPEIGTGADAPKVLGEALEELSTTTQEEESSEVQS
ncbi:MAG: SMC-Scp complex subunit ScpB [Armatimonadia bacterium]